MNVKNFARTALDKAKKNSPELLVAIGIAGFVGTVIVAVKTTPKAVRIVEQKEKKLNRDLTKKEIVKETWKLYVPTAITGVTSIACIIGGTAKNCKIKAGLAAAYTASEQSMKLYREKVIETLGEKKEQIVRDEVEKERIKKNPVTNTEVIVTGRGKTLCYEPVSGRYFEFEIEQLHQAIDKLNKMIRDEYYVHLNEFYYLVGLPQNDCGDILGWNSDCYPVEPSYSTQMTEDGRPCLVVDLGIGESPVIL